MLGFDKSFRNVDWSFVDSGNSSGVHTIHSYPAKFIPQIPKHAIDILYPGDSTVVLDPFCGSGTTLVEATGAGIDAYGIDLHPLACLISRVKTTPIEQGFEDTVVEILAKAQHKLGRQTVEIPPIPRLDHWFELPVQKALAVLVNGIREVERSDISDALNVALSSIIVQVSNQESDTRYAAKKNSLSAHAVFRRFEIAAITLSSTLRNHFREARNRRGTATVINSDILKVAAKDLPKNVGLVITSPPYPNAYEYWLYHKYRMYWLGMDPIAVKKREIGARPHYFKKNHQDEHDFERQMRLCFQLLSKVMIPNGRACFVVGRSIIHGRRIDNVQLLIRAAKPYGFTVEAIAERNIPTTRKAFNPSHGKINQEHVILFNFGDG